MPFLLPIFYGVVKPVWLANRRKSTGEFQGASEAPAPKAFGAVHERATQKAAQRTTARRVELKMVRRLRCPSITGR